MKSGRCSLSVRVLVVIMVAPCLSSCEGPRSLSWPDLFDVQSAVSLTEAGVAALVSYTTDSEAYSSPGTFGHVSVSSLRSGDPESVGARRDGSSGFAVTTVSGRDVARSVSFFPPHVLNMPYWTSAMRPLGAIGGDRIFVATNLMYPSSSTTQTESSLTAWGSHRPPGVRLVGPCGESLRQAGGPNGTTIFEVSP